MRSVSGDGVCLSAGALTRGLPRFEPAASWRGPPQPERNPWPCPAKLLPSQDCVSIRALLGIASAAQLFSPRGRGPMFRLAELELSCPDMSPLCAPFHQGGSRPVGRSPI